MTNKLVVFYSRAFENYYHGTRRYIEVGNTEKVANLIAELTNADSLRIEQKIPYANDYDTCIQQAQEDLENNARPEVINLPANLDKYDLIYLGYPNYWGTMPMAVYTFLESYDFSNKTIHPFCTHEGSGLCSTEQTIKQLANGAVVTKGLSIYGSKVDDSKEIIERWIKNEN